MKPILTRDEIEMFRVAYGMSSVHGPIIKAIGTITEAVELLRAVDKAFCTHEADEWYREHYFTVVEGIEAFLARYEGKEQE